MKLIRKSDQTLVLEQGKVADDFLTRLRGLIGTKNLKPGEGLLFPRCNSVHMWMMSIPIDVLFLKKEDRTWTILSLHAGLKPWKLLPVSCFKADDALELPHGSIERLHLKKGEVLCFAS